MIVYIVTNIANGKRYVGITTGSLSKRWYEHCWQATSGANQALYRAIRKYGIGCFSIEQIDAADSVDELLKKERHYIEHLGTQTKTGQGYNMTLGGDGVFGFEFSDKIKAAMAQAAIARFSDPSERERQRLRQKLFWTEIKRAEQSKRISEAHRRSPDLARQHSVRTAKKQAARFPNGSLPIHNTPRTSARGRSDNIAMIQRPGDATVRE